MGDEIVFDASSLTELSRDLHAAAERTRQEIDKTLVRVGAEVMAEAKAIASEHSSTVADTITMRVAPGLVAVRGGSADVPIAALWEMGNKGSKRASPTFRHPVFGSRTAWVEQPRYRFLQPALSADRRGVTKLMEQTWDRALEPYRMKPEA